MANIAYKYRLYPNAEQQILFAKTFGCCRKIWNLMLADKTKLIKRTRHLSSLRLLPTKKTIRS